LGSGKPIWVFPLAPIAAMGFLSWATSKWFRSKPDPSGRISQPLLQIAQIYRWVALIMSLWWVGKYIDQREQVWVLALLGLLGFAWSGWRKSRAGLLFAGAYTMAAIALFWLPGREADRLYLPNLLALLTLLLQQQLAKRVPERFRLEPKLQGTIIIIGGLSVWLFVSDWVIELARQTGSQGRYLTATYSALALVFFISGIGLRERVYRWLGLGILAFCLGRVMIVDVWKLEKEIYRVLSFTALGFVLLVLGFIYNKYQEKIKEWL
jgi:hypothetical protein